MATTDIRVWDGSAWVSLQGPDGQNGTDGINGTDGKTISDVQAFAATVDPVNNTTLGTATALATTTDDGSGNLTLTLNLGIPAGLPGADGIVCCDHLRGSRSADGAGLLHSDCHGKGAVSVGTGGTAGAAVAGVPSAAVVVLFRGGVLGVCPFC